MLKPEPAMSTAVMLTDTPVAVLARLQHSPQLGEFYHDVGSAADEKERRDITKTSRIARPGHSPRSGAQGLLSKPFLLAVRGLEGGKRLAGSVGVEGALGSRVLHLLLCLDGGTWG